MAEGTSETAVDPEMPTANMGREGQEKGQRETKAMLIGESRLTAMAAAAVRRLLGIADGDRLLQVAPRNQRRLGVASMGYKMRTAASMVKAESRVNWGKMAVATRLMAGVETDLCEICREREIREIEEDTDCWAETTSARKGRRLQHLRCHIDPKGDR